MSNEVKLNKDTIQTLRHSKCWSQDELAAAASVSIRTIQRVEKSGTASLETTKAIAAVFDVSPRELQVSKKVEYRALKYLFNYAWLIAFFASSLFFGMWIIDILIPTLKGADFNNQYEIHGNFRYLDFGGLSLFLGFALLLLRMLVEHLNINRLLNLRRD
jgi:transcriptional regulator with XRE-family HTH domain